MIIAGGLVAAKHNDEKKYLFLEGIVLNIKCQSTNDK